MKAVKKTDVAVSQNEALKALPTPWPWYVLVLTGFALTGLFPWLMVSFTLFRRGKKRIAAFTVLPNVLLFIFMSWGCLHIRLPWWWLTTITYVFNLVWAGVAWLFQRKLLGPAQKRYLIRDYKSWMTPILIGVIIGASIGTLLSVAPALENRMAMQHTIDTLDRKTILWEFFQYSFFGSLLGLLLGIWWAGESKRFRPKHVITFLSALALTGIAWLSAWYLLLFLIQGGHVIDSADFRISKWALIPPWVTGFRKFLLQFQGHDISTLLIVPLLFGTISRIRDFWKRSSLIVGTFFCLLPLSFTSLEWWSDIQGKIVYEMSAPDPHTRDSAHDWAAIMLKRYPNHLQWPKIAESLARFYYKEGKFQKSKAFYLEIVNRYQASNQWYWVIERARAALNNPDFGKPTVRHELDIPPVDYEEYLTRNWMALLSVIRYWKGPDVTESQVIIGLKNISRSDDKIELTPLVNLADLDDAARSLGYEVMILPAALPEVKTLISAGIPVIHPCYHTFYLIFGFDESRSAVSAYSFGKLSYTLRKEARNEAREILSMAEEGRGKSKNRLVRIANQAYREYSVDFWHGPGLRYISPLMAIVFPPEKKKMIADILKKTPTVLAEESDGYLATLIGLSYLNHADPLQAIEWARVGARKIPDDMPLYVAHLAKMFWEHRHSKIKSNIPLQDQFPELAKIFSYFSRSENINFLESAQHRFETDLSANSIPWIFSQAYIPMLDRSDPDDLNQTIRLIRGRLTLNPASYSNWKFLSRTYEWAKDIAGQVEALDGASSCKPLDSKSKLKLAYGYVLLERFSDAKAVLQQIDSSKVKFDADYPFCLGAIAEWEGNANDALKNYKAAIEMRRYKPVYHLKYGKLLIKKGKNQEARKVLSWAALIDAGESVKHEAKKLLSKID
jgi:tetratricopeptide (TPR) repeat protein